MEYIREQNFTNKQPSIIFRLRGCSDYAGFFVSKN